MEGTLGKVSRLDTSGIAPLLAAAEREQWGGAIRIRSGEAMAVLWLVKGQPAHAALLHGKTRAAGRDALAETLRWTDGTVWLEADVLPPERTIRESLSRILSEEGFGSSGTEPDRQTTELEALFETLRQRVPGLESISLTHEGELEATTRLSEAERCWLDRQLRLYFSDDRQVPEKLFLEQDEHTLLITKRGPLAAVLSARSGTAPEALFWAAEVARKQILTAS